MSDKGDPFRRPARGRPLLLDGGVSTALEDLGADLAGPLWSARLIDEAPERVASVHRAFAAAGAAGADLALVETLPRLDEALVVARLARGLALPVAISLQVRDARRTGAGDDLAGALAALEAAGARALGVNCFHPDLAPGLAAPLRAAAGVFLFARPNSGEGRVDGRWRGGRGPGALIAAGTRLAAEGWDAVGGCCRVRPADIAALGAALAAGRRS